MTRARELSKLANSNILSVDSSNNIGIGSTTPDAKLDVAGEVLVGTSASITSAGEAVFAGVVTSSTGFSGIGTGVSLQGLTATSALEKVVLSAGAQGGIANTMATSGSLYWNNSTSTLYATNVNVSGTMTTEDTQNVDSTGIVTAGLGFRATLGGLVVTAGVSTFTPYPAIDANEEVQVGTAIQLGKTGIVTALGLDISTGGVDIDGQTDLDELVVAGVATFSAGVDIGTGGVDIDGQLDVDELVVAGVATFSAGVDIGTGGVDIDGQLDVDELVVAGVATFSNNIIGTGATIYNATTGTEVGIVSALAIKGACTQVPQNAQGSTYTLLTKDAGKHINAANTITVDDGVFQIGDCVSIFNDTGGNITITQGSGVTLRLVATSTTGSRTLATYGLATLLCVGGDAGGGNEFVVSGGGVS